MCLWHAGDPSHDDHNLSLIGVQVGRKLKKRIHVPHMPIIGHLRNYDREVSEKRSRAFIGPFEDCIMVYLC